jgi:hypothetical protein
LRTFRDDKKIALDAGRYLKTPNKGQDRIWVVERRIKVKWVILADARAQEQ